MSLRWRVILLLWFLGGCNGGVLPQTPAPGCAAVESSAELAATFRALRATRGHFQGGDWNADVDAWMGRKHQVMLDLGARLGVGGCRQAQVTRLLGSPDRVARPGDAAYAQVAALPDFAPPAGPHELLIYAWRGSHDFLYLIGQAQTIVGSGWWYAED